MRTQEITGLRADDHRPAGMSAKSGTVEFVSFAIGNEHYGVDIMSVREIKGWSGVSPLVGQADYVRGVLNLRGAMIPIVDLRCRFGQGLTEATSAHVVIIVSIDGRMIGLLADQVLDIVTTEAGAIQPVPQIARDQKANLLSGLVIVDGGMIALIDLAGFALAGSDTPTKTAELAAF